MKPKQFIFSLILLFIVCIKSTIVFGQTYVTSAKVTFTTPSCSDCDDKDHDTKVRISVLGIYGNEVASAYYTEDKRFPDDGSQNDIPLTIRGSSTVFRPEVNQIQNMTVTIEPNGNDNWAFVPTLVFYLSDGSSIAYNFKWTKLSSNGHTWETITPQ